MLTTMQVRDADAEIHPAEHISKASPRPSRWPRAVWLSLIGTLIGFCLLQIWRPYFFLGDDNLTGAYPVWLVTAERFWSGQSPFTNPYLFSGKADWLHDPSGLSMWNPVFLLVSPLVFTPARLALIDAQALGHLLICAAAFSSLLLYLRSTCAPELSERRIVFLTLSYTFSVWMILVTPNWFNFLANQAALPLLLLGVLYRQNRVGVGLVTLGLLYGLFSGHLNLLIMSLLFLGVFVMSYGVQTKSWSPLGRLVLGGTIALVIALPLLVPAFSGFNSMGRNQALSVEKAALLRFPSPLFPLSFFLGSVTALASEFGGGKFHLFGIPLGPSVALVCCAASWCLFLSVGARRRWSALEISCAGVALLVALFVVRPVLLSQVLQHIPILRSTRIPFREIFAFLFFVHVWIALRPVTVKPILRKALPALGCFFFAFSLLPFRPGYFTAFPVDRHLILSGQVEPYWKQIRAELGPGEKFVPVLGVHVPPQDIPRVPWVLLGAYNYPSMVKVPSGSGYVIRGMQGSYLHDVEARTPIGSFKTKDISQLHKRAPKLRYLVLTSLDPVKIELRGGNRNIRLQIPELPPLSPDLREVVSSK